MLICGPLRKLVLEATKTSMLDLSSFLEGVLGNGEGCMHYIKQIKSYCVNEHHMLSTFVTNEVTMSNDYTGLSIGTK